MKKLSSLLFLIAACGGGDDAAAPDAGDPPPTGYGGDRPVELQRPEGFDESQQYPLVMLLHGYSASGLLQTAYLQLADVPAWGAFFMAPDGTPDADGNLFWNAGACCGNGGPDVDDVAYLGGLIDDVMADWPIDPARVYVMGHSNGHFMTYRLACERADVITAIAGLAGGATPTSIPCEPEAPVSSLHVHGDDDEVVPYEGGSLGQEVFPGALESTIQWAGRDGCAATRTAGAPLDLDRDLAGDETLTEAADGCPGGVGVELWTIQGGSHLPRFYPTIGRTFFDWLMAHPR